jgi:hypothetical protein
MLEHDRNPEARLEYGFRLVTARPPVSGEKAVLKEALKKYQARYRSDGEAARKLIAVGESSVDENLNPADLAAYTMVANLLLNLDETLNKN